MFCSNCGSQRNATTKFCANCSAAQAVSLEPVNPDYPPATQKKEVNTWKLAVILVFILTVTLIGGAVVGVFFAFNIGPFGDESYELYEPELKVVEKIVLPAHDPEPIPWGRLVDFYFRWYEIDNDNFNDISWSFDIEKRDDSYFMNVSAYDQELIRISNQQISEQDVDVIREMLEENDVIRWNGFNSRREGGYTLVGMFQLQIRTTSGIIVSAFGVDEFPENYEIIAPMLKEYLIDLARRFLPEPEPPEPERTIEPLDPNYELSTLPTSEDIWGEGALHPDAILYRLEIVYDLAELNLINHDLTRESFFKATELESVSGNIYMILSPIEGIYDPDGVVTHDGLRVGYNIASIEYPDYHDAVSVLIEWYTQILYNADKPIIPTSALRTNADRTIAVLPLRRFAPFEGEVISRFLMAQVIPENDEIILLNFFTWAIVTGHFSADRLAALEELCQLIGFDLLEYYDGVEIIDIYWMLNRQ